MVKSDPHMINKTIENQALFLLSHDYHEETLSPSGEDYLLQYYTINEKPDGPLLVSSLFMSGVAHCWIKDKKIWVPILYKNIEPLIHMLFPYPYYQVIFIKEPFFETNSFGH